MAEEEAKAMGTWAAYLEKCDPAKNQYRFYALTVMPTLFGGWSLMREWGRIGSPGQVRTDWFESLEAGQAALARWAYKKCRRGYSLGILRPDADIQV